MLILGHTGITLGAAALVAGAAQGCRFPRIGRVSWLTALGSYLDIRILMVGSLLPDIIDKPVGQFFFRETFSNGRIFSHTLLFLIVLAAAGYGLYRYRRKVWLLTLAAGTFMHLVLDQMWQAPRTLFWPLLGFGFEKGYLTDWLLNVLRALFSDPAVYIPEAVGLVILVWFGVVLIARRKVGVFVRYGRVS